jgi:hypothetical protein
MLLGNQSYIVDKSSRNSNSEILQALLQNIDDSRGSSCNIYAIVAIAIYCNSNILQRRPEFASRLFFFPSLAYTKTID